MLGFERSEFAEHPGWYIRFNDKDVIFLDPRGSSLRSRSRMTLRAEVLKTQFNDLAPSFYRHSWAAHPTECASPENPGKSLR